MSHEHYSVEEGETEEDRKRRFHKQAEAQLYKEGKIGFCGTDEDFREQRKKINCLAHEIEKREQYEELKKEFG